MLYSIWLKKQRKAYLTYLTNNWIGVHEKGKEKKTTYKLNAKQLKRSFEENFSQIDAAFMTRRVLQVLCLYNHPELSLFLLLLMIIYIVVAARNAPHLRKVKENQCFELWSGFSPCYFSENAALSCHHQSPLQTNRKSSSPRGQRHWSAFPARAVLTHVFFPSEPAMTLNKLLRLPRF